MSNKDFGTRTDLHPWTDHAERPDDDTLFQLGAGIDDRAWIDHRQRFRAVHMISAEATILPSTFAVAAKTQISRRFLITSTSRWT